MLDVITLGDVMTKFEEVAEAVAKAEAAAKAARYVNLWILRSGRGCAK